MMLGYTLTGTYPDLLSRRTKQDIVRVMITKRGKGTTSICPQRHQVENREINTSAH